MSGHKAWTQKLMDSPGIEPGTSRILQLNDVETCEASIIPLDHKPELMECEASAGYMNTKDIIGI